MTVRATAQFVKDFETVMEAFKVNRGEREEVKAICRADMAAAEASLSETASLIHGGWKPCK